MLIPFSFLVFMTSPVWAEERLGNARGTWQEVNGGSDCKFLNHIDSKPAPTTWSGLCQDGYVQGKGKIYYHNERGDTLLEGAFVDGVMQGEGVIVTQILHRGKNHLTSYIGEMKDGLLDGLGELYVEGVYRYTGEFKESLFQGQGHLTYVDGSRVEGNFVKGEPRGFVVLEVETEELSYRYAGGYDGRDKQGYGVQYFPNGTRYEGMFDDGWKHGSGIVFLPDGSSCKGEWKKGKFVGYGEGSSEGQIRPCFVDKNDKIYLVVD